MGDLRGNTGRRHHAKKLQKMYGIKVKAKVDLPKPKKSKK